MFFNKKIFLLSFFSLIDISLRFRKGSKRILGGKEKGTNRKKKKNGTKCRLIINNVLNQKYNVAKS